MNKLGTLDSYVKTFRYCFRFINLHYLLLFTWVSHLSLQYAFFSFLEHLSSEHLIISQDSFILFTCYSRLVDSLSTECLVFRFTWNTWDFNKLIQVLLMTH